MSQLVSVQFLRALAALMVVFGHAQHDALVWSEKTGAAFSRSHVLPWGAGVDLFFVISGFIMVYASREVFGQPGAGRLFATRRLVRIVPLYWLMAALYFLTLVIQLGATGKPLPALADIVAAFAFWPTDTFGDGVPRPFFSLGWTLNYEMFFYLCFALVLGLPMRRAVPVVAAGLAVLVALGLLVGPTVPALMFWSQPIVLEFVLGMGIAMAMLGGVRLGSTTRTVLVALASGLLAYDLLNAGRQGQDWITPNDLWRVLGWGVPAAMLVSAAVLGRAAPPRHDRATRLGTLLGDASYALYLCHPFVIVLVRKAMLATGLFSVVGGWALVAIVMILSALVAVAIHRTVELPVTGWLNRRLLRQQPRPHLSAQLA